MATDETLTPDQFAHGLGARVLHCRDLGHNWRDYTVTWDKKAKCYERQLRCSSCRTIRHQLLDSGATVLTNRYTYPKGYLASNVSGGVDRQTFRLEALTRATEQAPRLKAV